MWVAGIFVLIDRWSCFLWAYSNSIRPVLLVGGEAIFSGRERRGRKNE